MRSASQTPKAPTVRNAISSPHLSVEQTKGRRFKLLPPGTPRTVGEKTSFKTRVVRFAYPLMPKGPRTVTGSRDTHKATRAFLAAVMAAPMTSKEVEMHLAAVGRASRPLRGSDPKVAGEVFKQSLEMQLKTLPMEDLKQLLRQIDKAAPGANDPVISRLGDMVHEECGARLRSDLGDRTTRSEPGVAEALRRIVNICDEALRALPNDPATAEDKLRTLEGRTLSLVGTYGLKRRGADEYALSTQLLKDIFALCLLRNDANTAELLQVFLAMPSAMRAELRAAPAAGFPDALADIDKLLDQATATKHDQLEASLIRACAEFEACVDLPNSLEQQAAQLDLVIAQGKALDTHCDAHKATTERGISEKARAAFDHARRTAARLDLSHLDPKQLSHQALHQLDKAFEALAVTAHTVQIQVEKQRRKGQCNAPFHLATTETLKSLADGDLATAMKHLERVQQRFSEALEVHLALGERAHDLDGRSALFARLLNEFLSSQPSSTVRKWASALGSDQALLLAEALEAFGREASTPHHQAVGQAGTLLKLLRIVLDRHHGPVLAKHRDTKPSTLNDLQVQHATRVMNETTRKLVQNLTGSDPQRMEGTTQDAMKEVLNAITRSVRDDAPDLAWNDTTKDIVRVAMSDTDDNHRLAMDRLLQASIQTALSSQRTHFFVENTRIDKAVQLHDKLPITTAQLRSLSKLANTDIWKSANVDKALASSEDTPVRLSDGSPLRLDMPQNDDIYRIAQGDDGQLNVTVERVQSKALDTVNLANGQRAAVNKDTSTVTLSAGFTLHPDGSLCLARPVSCHAHIDASDAS